MTRFLVLTLLPLCVWLSAAAPASAQVQISEFVADNQTTTVVDEDGDHPDWLELWNSDAAAVSLNGWYLSDKASDLRKWQFPTATPAVTLAAGGRLIVFCSGKNRKLTAARLHTSFKLAKEAGNSLTLTKPDGLTISSQYASYPRQVQDIAYGIPAQTQTVALVSPGAAGKFKVPLSAADQPANWTAVNYDDSGWTGGASGFGYDTTGSYGSFIGTGGNLQAAMYNANGTALIRIPFTVASLSGITALKLSMKYDDGFVCYLNGTQIFASNAPATPAWNSAAVADRAGTLTATYQVFTGASLQTLLTTGPNVLCFQLLNYSNGSTQDTDSQGSANGSRALCLPLLEAMVDLGVSTPYYLSSCTPGSANSAAVTSFGPIITQTTSTAPRPTGLAGSAPIVVSAKVVSSLLPLNATNPVQLKWRLMQNTEQSVVMKDDGVAPDAVAGDGVYTAQFSTVISPGATAGQMFRWRVEAKDSATTPAVRTDPPYGDPTDNEQYYGTVTQDGITTSQLPILHWFLANPSASRTEAGTRGSLFYLDQFYDNVFSGLHGQSSSGFAVNKKSVDFNFNEDNRFLWKVGEDRQKALNLITTWADKSRVRDCLAWETWASSGHLASHWVKTVRVQQNGAFFGLFDMVENGDDDFLKRAGLDPLGAFYKSYNSLQNADTTGTYYVEKKTRETEDTSDLLALETAMDTATVSLASRRQYAYDNVDLASLVNYLAMNVLIINNDFGHKNYYIYRDTNGTGEWSLLPWDEDLTFGHTWTSSQGYFNDDIDSQKGLVIGAAAGNRVMNLIMNSTTSTIAPEMASMFVRRLRTLMDTMYGTATATTGPFETRIGQLLDAIDPPGATYLTDADLDFQLWGYWVDGGGSPIASPSGDAATDANGPRVQAQRILNTNAGPSSVSNAEGLGDTTPAFLPGRRAKLFNGGLTIAGKPIPASQAATPTGLTIEYVDANPGNQDQEYFIIRNGSANFVDISGWKIAGAVQYTFRGGTVIPPFTSGSAITATGDVHQGRLHVARNPYGFRHRTVSPKGGEYRQVTGPYTGQLSARGGTINLVQPGATPAADVVIATTTYAANPTPAQNYLRVTELAYNPTDPTASELAALPGVVASDFEFVELTNTGPSTLALGGASFTAGISFTFPAGFTLGAGQRCVIAALTAAYNLRYGSSGATLAGQYDGHLDNAGEQIQLTDPAGEVVLDFTYDPLWYGISTAGGTIGAPPKGYSLVTRAAAPAWDSYGNAATWALGAAGGSPGTTETADTFANSFVGWRKDYFTAAEEGNSAVSGPAADPDGDGRSNLHEFVFGGDPHRGEAPPAPVVSTVSVSGANYMAITFARRHNLLDVTVTVECSGDLTNWTTVNLPVGNPMPLGAGLDTVTYRDSVATNPAAPRYIRVRAVKP